MLAYACVGAPQRAERHTNASRQGRSRWDSAGISKHACVRRAIRCNNRCARRRLFPPTRRTQDAYTRADGSNPRCLLLRHAAPAASQVTLGSTNQELRCSCPPSAQRTSHSAAARPRLPASASGAPLAATNEQSAAASASGVTPCVSRYTRSFSFGRGIRRLVSFSSKLGRRSPAALVTLVKQKLCEVTLLGGL